MTEKLKKKDFFEEDNVPIAVFKQLAISDRLPHLHDFFEIMVISGGTAVHDLGDQKRTIAMGDLFVIAPGQTHAYKVAKNCTAQVVNLLFDLPALNFDPRDLTDLTGYHALFTGTENNTYEPHLCLNAKDLAFVCSIIDAIEAELEEEAVGFRYFCCNKLRELILFLARRYSHVCGPSGKNFQKIGQLISYMEEHLGERLQFESLVEVSTMSPSSLRRIFSREFGCSPMAYLQKLRVKKAMLLLSDMSMSVTDVSYEVGFNDSGYFAGVFKKETGETPKSFRESLRK